MTTFSQRGPGHFSMTCTLTMVQINANGTPKPKKLTPAWPREKRITDGPAQHATPTIAVRMNNERSENWHNTKRQIYGTASSI
jgi:hypothetical protein